MGIFSSIKDAIFGHKAAEPKTDTGGVFTGTAPAATDSSAATQTVDVEQVLAAKAADTKQDLNWRSSIVDLMKLVGIDSSLDNRKALARELGYTGALDGSAEMNIWLHKATMRELEKNGGRVPADMLD
ncbi:DUF3597 domain-containing protein [Sphingorhabdus soli]|uniref:DUF3597 domain-containing protein n=1 Tax=Flavisphingopyxis soli TaxID=2601267 RepID=A0A5C6U7E0_9SPHN|nr:DUF3597 domain-containing protein [Sphingorhabdus soli]TXC68933.1 DUF3597 domain-containing protein [Sphingorhabdus soli]